MFEDINDNGILDASETTSIQSTTVGSDGTYSFEENYSGGTDSYIVSTSESSYPANYDLTTDNIEVASFTTGGNTDENNDFGANSFNTITGMVFLDADVDTINDAAEVGVEDVTIYLYEDTNGNGIVDASESTPIAVDTTDANGAYIFKVPYNGGTENYLMSAESAAFPTSTLLTTDNTESATFASSGNTDPNNDFGLSSGNRITGTVFSDVNGDGDIDAGDAGEAGVTIYLYNDADGDGVINGAESAPIDSTTTASDGTYIFHVDYSGSTDNFIVDTDLGDYPSLSSLTTDNIESATFTTGGNVDPNNDFGFNLGNSISGTVFLDKDLDGFMDSDDDGTGNILVVLYEDLDGDGDITAGDIFIDSTRTDANGDYEFLAPYDGGTDRFVLEIDTNTIGGNKTLTTDNLEVAVFASGGNTDPNNNFGYNCTLNSGISGPTTSCAESDEIFSVDPAVSGATNTCSFTGDYTTSSLPTEESQTLSWDNKGVYTVKLVVEYKGCIDSFEQTININDAVQAIADDADTVCRNGAITLDGSNSTSGVDFNWSVVSGDIFSIDVGATTSQPAVSPLITTIYKMTVTNPTNGCSTIDYTTVNVNVQKNPSASLQVPSTVVDSTTIKLDGSGSTAPVDNPTATLMYGWFKDGVQLDVTFDDTLQTNILGDADYSLVVVDITNSCTDTAVVRIEPISNPLPVELIEFTATLVDDEDVEVKWTTASELNNHYFIVQRRFEHEAEFTNVSEKIDGKGTSSSKNSYTFTDTENTWLNTVAYYRLVQYDLDGTLEIHKEEAVRNSQQKISVSVFPNPARTSTCVKVNNNKVSSIQLYDAYGSPVGDERIIRMESNIYEINLNGLSKGNYILKVISNNQVVTSKVIVL